MSQRKNIQLTPAQKKIVADMQSGKKLSSYRFSHISYGSKIASITTINKLIEKGVIQALPEKAFGGDAFQTDYVLTELNTICILEDHEAASEAKDHNTPATQEEIQATTELLYSEEIELNYWPCIGEV